MIVFYFTDKGNANLGRGKQYGKYFITEKQGFAFAKKEINKDGSCIYSIKLNLRDRSPCRLDANLSDTMTFYKRVDQDTFFNYVMYLNSGIYNYYHMTKDALVGA